MNKKEAEALNVLALGYFSDPTDARRARVLEACVDVAQEVASRNKTWGWDSHNHEDRVSLAYFGVYTALAKWAPGGIPFVDYCRLICKYAMVDGLKRETLHRKKMKIKNYPAVTEESSPMRDEPETGDVGCPLDETDPRLPVEVYDDYRFTLSSLSLRQREILVSKYAEEETSRSIAERLGVSEQWVCKMLIRSREYFAVHSSRNIVQG